MSQTMRIINKIASILNHKPSDSVSSRPSRVVRDSHQTIEGRCITNIPAGTITGLIAMLAIPALFIVPDSHAYTASITTSGAPSINVKPGTDGGTGTSIGSDAITVTTTCRAGYNLTMSTSVNDNNLYLNGSSSNNTSGQYFTPSDGTTALSSAPNTWGYYFNASSPTTAPTKDSTFNAVPASTSSAAVIKTPTASATDITDNFNVYYGVAVSNNTPLGTYKMIPATSGGSDYGSITYYLTMAESCLPYIVNFNQNAPEGATVTGTMNPQTIGTNDTTALTTNTYEADGYTFNGWNTAADGTGTAYTDGENVTNIASPGATITLYAQWEEESSTLYDMVARQVKTYNDDGAGITCTLVNGKCTQTLAQMQAVITAPTSGSTPATDTSNSGVFLYDASTYGTASDAANTSDIYYFRGILDSNLDGTTSTYGSNGDSAYYQNYVILDADGTKTTADTCWRIVRTTGSGGVKMIYNGNWTGSTCAHTTTAAQINSSTYYFNRPSTYASASCSSSNNYCGTLGFIAYVGYNYNSTYGYNNTSYTSPINNSTLFNNGTTSNAKTKIESWYNSKLSSYTDLLEASAGYCNDRTTYSGAAISTETTSSIPYKTTSATVNFGAYIRNRIGGNKLSLTCPNDTGHDLLTTSNGLNKPIALLTEDEVALAGNGSEGGISAKSYTSSNFHYNSYLRSGSTFWLLSPAFRNSAGAICGFDVSDYLGNSGSDITSSAYGLRPAISLKLGTSASSGSGTATDPWVVTTP